jgi:hypothetical protein
MPYSFAIATTFSKKFEFHALRGRVAGEIEDQHLRARPEILDRFLHFLEEVDARRHRQMADIGAGNHRAVDVNRVTRIRHQHDIAAIQRRQCQVGDALLGADGGDGFLFRIEIDVVTRLVPVADRFAQPRDTLGYGITMRVAAPRGLDHFLDDMRRRGLVGIAHAEVDDVFAPPRAAIFRSPVMLKT